MAPFLALIIALDAAIGVGVLLYLVHRRKTLLGELAGIMPSRIDLGSLQALSAFAREQHPRIGEWMRTHWSGMPDQLPAAISTLLAQLERDARARNLPVERDAIKAMLASSLSAHKIGPNGALSEAFKHVA